MFFFASANGPFAVIWRKLDGKHTDALFLELVQGMFDRP